MQIAAEKRCGKQEYRVCVTVLLILTYSELVKPLLKRQLLVLIHNLRIQKWFESCRISLRRKVREWNSSD